VGSHAVATLCPRFADLRQRQLDPSSSLHKKPLWLCLEFDLRASPADLPVPAVFFQSMNRDLRVGAGEDWRFARETMETLLGEPLSPASVLGLEQAAEHLPNGKFVAFVGIMFSRPRRPLRVTLGRFVQDDLMPFLEARGWSSPRCAQVLESIRGLSHSYGVSLELAADRLAPRIGIECFVDDGPARPGGSWDRFLGSLVDAGLCRPERKEAALAWPGGAGARFINHIKLVTTFQAERPGGDGDAMSAKVYLNGRQLPTMN
jgi:hypothetical protein